MKNNQKGFSVVEGILLLVIIGVIGGVGYFVFNSQKQANKSLDNTAKNDNTTTKKETPNATVAEIVNGYLVIKEWSVKVPYTENIKGLSYTLTDEGVYGSSALFRSDALNSASGKDCSTNSFKLRRGSSSDLFSADAGDSKATFKTSYDEQKAAGSGSDTSFPTIYSPGVVIKDYYYVQWGAEKTMHCTSYESNTPEPQDKESLALDDIATALSNMVSE